MLRPAAPRQNADARARKGANVGVGKSVIELAREVFQRLEQSQTDTIGIAG